MQYLSYKSLIVYNKLKLVILLEKLYYTHNNPIIIFYIYYIICIIMIIITNKYNVSIKNVFTNLQNIFLVFTT